MQFITRPLQNWPRPRTDRRIKGSYSVSYDKTLRMLEYELRKIGVTGDAVLQLDITESDVRRDGLPYADAKIRSPRVALAFTCRHGPLTYYCDRFFHWQSNVRAIGLGLERLRLVEETGIVSRGEQYTGFKQLGSGIELGPAVMTIEEAARWLAAKAAALEIFSDPLDRHRAASVGAEGILNDRAVFDLLYKLAAKRLHPDAGGDRGEWDKLQRAEVVEKFHKQRGGS